MRLIKYKRHELHKKTEYRTSQLSTFVYDIPYFGACGIFTPYHIINQIFNSGGSEGGMSPGATWESFRISKEEYDELVDHIINTEPKSFGAEARYKNIKYEFDNEFDEIKDYQTWIKKVCDKHRKSYHKKISGLYK